MNELSNLSLTQLEGIRSDIVERVSQCSQEDNIYEELNTQLLNVENEIKNISNSIKNNITTSIDVVINPKNFKKFNKGFVAQDGMNIYVQCPECGELHKIIIGQCYILDDKNKDYKDCCLNNISDLYTSDIFELNNVLFIYSDSKYCLYNNEDDDKNIDLKKSIGKLIGESKIEDYHLDNDKLIPLSRFMKDNNKYSYIINSNDMEALLFISYIDVSFDRIYTICDNLEIKKIKSIKIDMCIDYE